MALEHGWLRKILSCLTPSDIEAKKKEFMEKFGLGPELVDNFAKMENDSKKVPRKRRHTINIRPADSKKDQRKRRKTTNFHPVSKASFRFKMDHVTQRQTDVNFYSEKKFLKNLPWKVKLQPNIYGVEGKDFYFLECFFRITLCIVPNSYKCRTLILSYRVRHCKLGFLLLLLTDRNTQVLFEDGSKILSFHEMHTVRHLQSNFQIFLVPFFC